MTKPEHEHLFKEALNRDQSRRHYIDLYTPAESAIRAAMDAVEVAGAHPHLTRAVILLGEAKDAVADFVDGMPEKPAAAPCKHEPPAQPETYTRAKVTPETAKRLKALGVDAEPNVAATGDCLLALLTAAEAMKKQLIPEKVQYQTLVHKHGQEDDHMTRVGEATKDLEAAEGQALRALSHHTVKEVFVATVHSAYSKELAVKKRI